MDRSLTGACVPITKVSINIELNDFVYFYIKDNESMEIELSTTAYNILRKKNLFYALLSLCGQDVLKIEFALDGETTQRDFITTVGRFSIVDGAIFQDIGVYLDS